ncbi:hypothetical protein EI94DRAFT_1755892 [Lactarius quietus]|nr:hypothetical protein EI94DRAFT_1755892 [Lactarius quietus]
MDELRAHPFFAPIRWDTLWDDPAPPLETGLVRREPAPADEWDDVGATWDELVSLDESDDEDRDDGSSGALVRIRTRVDEHGDDGIEWGPDAQTYLEIPDYAPEALPLLGVINGVDAVNATMSAGGDVEDARGEHTVGATVSGTHGIQFALPGIDEVSKNTDLGTGAIEDSAATDEATGSGVRSGPGPGPSLRKDEEEEEASPVSSTTEVGDREGAAALDEEPPQSSAPLRVVCDSYANSSSDGSPVEKLSAELEAMGIHRGGLLTRDTLPATSLTFRLLFRASALAAGEKTLFHAPVGETALKRRTSRLLLPLPVAQRKPKVRELALTNHRPLSLEPLKNGRGVCIKAEFGLREAQTPAKRANGDKMRGIITGVERKSAKEFVGMTTGKLAFFVVESEAAADARVRRIVEALQQHSTQNRECKQLSNNDNHLNVSATPRT